MEYQVDMHYDNGAEDFFKAFSEAHLIQEIASIDWAMVGSITIKPWED